MNHKSPAGEGTSNAISRHAVAAVIAGSSSSSSRVRAWDDRNGATSPYAMAVHLTMRMAWRWALQRSAVRSDRGTECPVAEAHRDV